MPTTRLNIGYWEWSVRASMHKGLCTHRLQIPGHARHTLRWCPSRLRVESSIAMHCSVTYARLHAHAAA